MKNNNHQKVVLITGASSGMGKDFAHTLIKQGHTVYGAARRTEKMQDFVDAGGHALKLDITNEEHIQSVVDQIIKEQGRIDVLINNAGYGSLGAIEQVPLEEARRQFDINLFGLARLTQFCLPHMRQQQSGTIINISSIGGKICMPLGGWYHATKYALEGWSDSLRVELQPFGINVVIIEPGGIQSEFDQVAMANLQATTADGPYKSLAEKYINAYKSMINKLSSPKVITDLVVKAIQAKRPRTRYSAGAYSGTLLCARHHLSDRMFDRLLKGMLK